MNSEIRSMAIDARDVLTTTEWLIAGGTLMTAIAVGIKKVYRLARNVESSLAKMDQVQAQLSPNGGNSLHDKITQLAGTIARAAEHANAVDEKLEDLSQRMRRLESYHMEKLPK